MKEGQKCYALLVNVVSGYISFKISQGRYLGKAPVELHPKYNLVFEDSFESVDYLSASDIFLTKNDAVRALIKMLSAKVKKRK